MRVKCECSALIKAIDVYIEKADNDLSNELDEAGYADADETVEEIAKLENRIKDALVEETQEILQAIEDVSDLETFAQDVWPDVKKADKLDRNLQEIFWEELSLYLPQLAKNYSRRIDPEVVVEQISKRTTSFIESWSAELGRLMKLNSHREIETILKEGLEKGQGIPEFIRAIQKSGIRDEYYKARRVAVTEVLRAHSYAQDEAIMQSPAADRKKWVHTGGRYNEVRENHVELNNKTIPKDQLFVLKGKKGETHLPMFPHDTCLPPEEVINCHCLHVAVVSDEVLGIPYEERLKMRDEARKKLDAKWEAKVDAKHKTESTLYHKVNEMKSGDMKTGKTEQVGQIDFSDRSDIMEVIGKAQESFTNLDFEAECTITTDGKVWITKGEAYEVTSNISSNLKGCYTYHNHPAAETHYSFSAEDVGDFLSNQMEYSACSDDKYSYYMQRTKNTSKAEYNDVLSHHKSLYFQEAVAKAHQNDREHKYDYNIDEDGYHVTMQKYAQDANFVYRRERKG